MCKNGIGGIEMVYNGIEKYMEKKNATYIKKTRKEIP